MSDNRSLLPAAEPEVLEGIPAVVYMATHGTVDLAHQEVEVRLEPSAAFMFQRIVRPNSGALLVSDHDLCQLFDLIVDRFGIDLDSPVRDHYGWRAE